MKRYVNDSGDLVVAQDNETPHDYWIPLPDGMTFEKREPGDGRRVFYIDVGQIPNFDAEAFMDKLKANLERNKSHHAEVSTRWECDSDVDLNCCGGEPCGEGAEAFMETSEFNTRTAEDIMYEYVHAATEQVAETIMSRYRRWSLMELQLRLMEDNPELLIAQGKEGLGEASA